MGQIAQFLVTAFIVVALWLDTRESRGVSRAIWIPFLWFAVSMSKSFTYWVYPHLALQWSPVSDLQGNPLDRTFLFTLMALGLVCLYRRRREFSFAYGDNRALWAFFIYALASVSWSDYHGPALKRWVRAAGDIIIILTILTEENPGEAFERILRRCAIVLIPLSVYYIKYARWIGVVYYHDGMPRFVGATGNKNQLGILCAFAGIFLAWRIMTRRPKVDWIDVTLLALTAYLLYKSNSATSTVVFLMGLLLLFVQTFLETDKRKLMRIIAVSFILLLVFQTVFIGVLGDSIFSFLFSATGRDSSFTGRLPLWQTLLKIGSRRPILGFGFGSFWLGEQSRQLWNTFLWRPTTGHNGYLDVFIDLGLVGLALLALLIVKAVKTLLARYDVTCAFHRLQLSLLIMCLAHNMTESSFGRGSVFIWILLLWLSAVVRKKEAPVTPQFSAVP